MCSFTDKSPDEGNRPRPDRDAFHLGWRKRIGGQALAVVAALFRLWSVIARKERTAPIRAVLILEPFGMGDVISLEPLIRRLRENGFEVRVCARQEWRSLFRTEQISEWLHPEIPWTSYDSNEKYRFTRLLGTPFWMFVTRLRRIGVRTIGLDPRGDIRSVLLLYLAGCRQVVTLANYLGSDLDIPRAAAATIQCPEGLRRWELNLLLAEALDAAPAAEISAPRLPHLFRAKMRSGSRQIGLIPIAPWRGKWWEPHRWAALREKLCERQWRVLGLCGPGQIDVAQSQLGDDVSIWECASVEDWATRLCSCDVVISVDTGPMHLADALDVPVIALFGEGKLPLWKPSGPLSRVVAHQGDPDFFLCHPIEENTYLGQRFMNRISVAEIVAAVDGIQCQLRSRSDLTELGDFRRFPN